MADRALPELPEAEARGIVAALYARIRAESGVPLVNYVWRHLATLPGGAAGWAWDVAQANAGRLPVRTVASQADLFAATLAGPTPRLPPLGVEATAILAIYNRSNAANLNRIAAVLAALGAPGSAPPSPGPTPTSALPNLPPLPGSAVLGQSDRDAAVRLADAGPAAESGVAPSLWRHLALQSGLMPALAPSLAPILASPSFCAAWRGLQDAAAPPDELCVPPIPAGMDRAGVAAGARAFVWRIAELTLAGRIIALWGQSSRSDFPKNPSRS